MCFTEDVSRTAAGLCENGDGKQARYQSYGRDRIVKIANGPHDGTKAGRLGSSRINYGQGVFFNGQKRTTKGLCSEQGNNGFKGINRSGFRRFNKEQGFTLVELIAVTIIIAVIAGATVTHMAPSVTFQLQTGRDTLVAALFHAQQRALAQNDSVRLTTSGGTIDIRQDTDDNSTFESDESIRVGGTQYPITLEDNVSITSHTFDYDKLGETTGTTITISMSSSSVVVTVTDTGFAY